MLKAFLQLPLIRQLHTRNLLFPTLALLAVAGVLLQGALYQPPPETSQPPARKEPLSLPATRPTLGKTPLNYFSDYWLQVAQESRGSLLLTGQDKTSAIVVAPGVAVSSVAAAEDALAMQMLEHLRLALDKSSDPADSAPVSAAEAIPPTGASEGPEPEHERLLGIDQKMGLAIFEIPSTNGASPFERADPLNVESGSYVAAVSLSPDGELRLTPGVAVSRPLLDASTQSYSVDVSIPLPENRGASAVVDLDGALLAVAIGSGPAVRVFSTEAIQGAIQRMRDRTLCQPFEVTDIRNDVREVLHVEQGLVVERVWDGLVANPAIDPGDILLEWAGKPVGPAKEFRQFYQEQEPGVDVSYMLQRGDRKLRGKAKMPDTTCLPQAESMAAFARLGLVAEWEPIAANQGTALEGWNVLGVLDGSPAALGGLRRGDSITSIQGRPLRAGDRRPFERYESRPQPMVLEVRRGDRVLLLAVTPPEEKTPTSESAPTQP